MFTVDKKKTSDAFLNQYKNARKLNLKHMKLCVCGNIHPGYLSTCPDRMIVYSVSVVLDEKITL